MTQKKPGQTVIQGLLSLILVCFILSFAVVFTLNFRPLYYFDMNHLEIPKNSGYPAEQIRENYDVLIDYNNLWGPKSLEFPTLSMSETGRIHFEEVKAIFVTIEILCMVTFILGLAGILWQHRRRDLRYLKYSAVLTIALPVILGGLIALNWDKAFVIFHKIFFNNDYWIFSADTDPVITILPDTFFLHCALMILALIVLGSILCAAVYKIHRKGTHKS